MRFLRVAGLAAATAAALALVALWVLGRGAGGTFDSDTLRPVPYPRAPRLLGEQLAAQEFAAENLGGAAANKQILFGDLHVHTTISFDAFMLNLPMLGGQGAATPADACDFARHCAGLDFWSINDHASNILPRDWQNSIEAVRQCNALAGSADDPDMVTFLGWEWTQAGATPEDHYGHKNVVLLETDPARVPMRPIAAGAGGTAANPPATLARGLLALGGARYRDLALRWTALSDIDSCPPGDVHDLGPRCREIAATPAELFAKLDQWSQPALVIPHGTAWGIYTPPSSSWDKQLRGAMHDPTRQRLIEVYSGHGSTEVYRDWRPVEVDDAGVAQCPPVRADYLPMCRRAGEIIFERCVAEGIVQEECAARAAEATRNAAAAGSFPHVTVAGATGADWRDAGQCRDCGQPAFKYRPAGSAQYIAALGDFSDGAAPRRFRMGFIASSDIHSARPGTGYKELRRLSESPPRRPPSGGGAVAAFFMGEPEEPSARSRTYDEAAVMLSGIQRFENERTRSFLYTGGLVAVHSEGRGRERIWDALQRREVYGTSGPRILLWFDLLAGEAEHPMGSEVRIDAAPVLRVRAAGSFEQIPGCPNETVESLGADRVAALCGDECYRPSRFRRKIERIEVVRIRPQIRADENVARLIDDPWRVFECEDDGNGCAATFVDDELPELGRDALYYARVFETPSATVNGDPLGCRRDAAGACVEVELCGSSGECLAPYSQRAWSSPIFVDYASSPRVAE